MKTIKEYKEEFIKLAKELEKDYKYPIRSIYIGNVDGYECDIDF